MSSTSFPLSLAPAPTQVIVGVVTEMSEWHGFVNEDIFFKKRNVVGELPSVGDNVVAEVERVGGATIKLEATSVHFHSKSFLPTRDQNWALAPTREDSPPPPPPPQQSLETPNSDDQFDEEDDENQSRSRPRSRSWKNERKLKRSRSTIKFDNFRHRQGEGSASGRYLLGDECEVVAVVGTSDIPPPVKPKKVFFDANGVFRALPEFSSPLSLVGTKSAQPLTTPEVGNSNSLDYFPDEGEQHASNAENVADSGFEPSPKSSSASTIMEGGAAALYKDWARERSMWEADQQPQHLLLEELTQEREVELWHLRSEGLLMDPRSPRRGRTPILRRPKRSRSESLDRALRPFRNPSYSPGREAIRKERELTAQLDAFHAAREREFEQSGALIDHFAEQDNTAGVREGFGKFCYVDGQQEEVEKNHVDSNVDLYHYKY